LGVIGLAGLPPSGVGGWFKELHANKGDLLLVLKGSFFGPRKDGLKSLVNASGFLSSGIGLTFLTGFPSFTYFFITAPLIFPLKSS